MTSVELPPHALAALLEKYNQLVTLRARRDNDPHAAPTPEGKLALKLLAQRYPGCLRELDRLPLTALRQRQAEVARAMTKGPTCPWMLWIWGYHQLLAAALAHKAGHPAATVHKWPLVNTAFLEQTLRPAGGRLSHVVMAELAQQVGKPPETLAAALFPPRRAA